MFIAVRGRLQALRWLYQVARRHSDERDRVSSSTCDKSCADAVEGVNYGRQSKKPYRL